MSERKLKMSSCVIFVVISIFCRVRRLFRLYEARNEGAGRSRTSATIVAGFQGNGSRVALLGTERIELFQPPPLHSPTIGETCFS
ncbi:hypothetical protein HAX54_008304 [Datura stramonium]|uniref:Secreted protein n=1 Tax=Datura stramonium TaxID=4076 RepID=A0ABS8RVK7_DATST|nr:hypothetical protein [Datura stramonium]